MKEEACQKKELIQMDTRYELSECMQHRVSVIHVTEWLNFPHKKLLDSVLLSRICVLPIVQKGMHKHTWYEVHSHLKAVGQDLDNHIHLEGF